MGRIGDPSAVSVLIEAMKDKDPAVRSAAAAALERIGDPSAVSVLCGALKDESREVRRNAAAALGRNGERFLREREYGKEHTT